MIEEQPSLIAAARTGDNEAFASLTEPHRHELIVHCYRMLGSLQQAEDSVQETFLRAWRRLETFQGRASFRAWLYKIATNLCLDALAKQPRRTLVQDTAAPSMSPMPIFEPVEEPIWLEPLPDQFLPPDQHDPEARYTQRETIRLAFLTLLQRLPPRQRAILILRDVLSWDTTEAASLLEISESAVTSALFRARQTMQEHDERRRRADSAELPPQDLLNRYMRFWEEADVDGLVALLKADAVFTMPPMPSWYLGNTAIGAALRVFAFPNSDKAQWRIRLTTSNDQPAFAIYHRDSPSGRYQVFGLQVVTVQDNLIARLDTFLDAALLRYFNFPTEI